MLQPQQAHGRWLLDLPSTALRDVTLFGPFAADGSALAGPQASGLMRPFASRPLGPEHLTFPWLPPSSRATGCGLRPTRIV